MKILKFGGAAIGTCERIQSVVAIIEQDRSRVTVTGHRDQVRNLTCRGSKYGKGKNADGH